MHATDPDGKPITYKIVGGADASQFKIDPTSDVLSFKSHPHDGKTYSLTVAAFDGPPGSAGSLSDVQTLTVKVANGLMNGSATSNDTFDLGHKFGVELVTNFDDKTLFANTTDVLAHAQEVVLFGQHETNCLRRTEGPATRARYRGASRCWLNDLKFHPDVFHFA